MSPSEDNIKWTFYIPLLQRRKFQTRPLPETSGNVKTKFCLKHHTFGGPLSPVNISGRSIGHITISLMVAFANSRPEQNEQDTLTTWEKKT